MKKCLCLFICFFSLQAQEECEHRMGLTISVEYLHTKPNVYGLDYAGSFKNQHENHVESTKSRFYSLCLNSEEGLRFRVSQRICPNLELIGAFSTIDISKKGGQTLKEPSISNFLTNLTLPGIFQLPYSSVSGKYETDYRDWEIAVRYQLATQDGCFLLSPYIGFSGMTFDQDFKTNSTSPLGLVAINKTIQAESRWKSDFHSFGLIMGSQFLYNFCNQVQLFAWGALHLTEGKPKTQYCAQFTETDTQNIKRVFNYRDDNCSNFVPGYHLGIGLQYSLSCYQTTVKFKAGYEHKQWHYLASLRKYPRQTSNFTFGSSQLTPPANTNSFGLRGFFAGIEAAF